MANPRPKPKTTATRYRACRRPTCCYRLQSAPKNGKWPGNWTVCQKGCVVLLWTFSTKQSRYHSWPPPTLLPPPTPLPLPLAMSPPLVLMRAKHNNCVSKLHVETIASLDAATRCAKIVARALSIYTRAISGNTCRTLRNPIVHFVHLYIFIFAYTSG